MLGHGFECVFGFVFVACQEEQYLLVIEIILIEVDFLLGTILIELFEFSLFVVIMFNLSIEIESGSFLIK